MVGSHESGIEAASEDLYDQGLTIITGKKNQIGFGPILAFWKSLSRKVIVMNSAEHDQRVAEISHLPHLLSVCLIQTPAQASLEIAAAGFRDTTRLAAGPDSVWTPIFIQNRKALLRSIKAFKSNLDQFETLLRSNQAKKVAAALRGASLRRERLSQSTKP